MVELFSVLYPLFVYTIFEMCGEGFFEEAQKFADKYGGQHRALHANDVGLCDIFDVFKCRQIVSVDYE